MEENEIGLWWGCGLEFGFEPGSRFQVRATEGSASHGTEASRKHGQVDGAFKGVGGDQRFNEARCWMQVTSGAVGEWGDVMHELIEGDQ